MAKGKQLVSFRHQSQNEIKSHDNYVPTIYNKYIIPQIEG